MTESTKTLPIGKTPTPEELFELGAHIGHSKSRCHPKMKKFIFGTRNGIELFDLDQTITSLLAAEEFVANLGRTGKTILWVGSKPASRAAIADIGDALGMPYINQRWLGGMLTNFKVIEVRLNYWKKLEKEVASGDLEKYVKRERLMKIVELRKLTRMFSGLRNLKTIPDAMVIVDPKHEGTALLEALQKKVTIVALVNSDCNPEGVKYPIPANDDSIHVVKYLVGRLSAAYEAGKKELADASLVSASVA